MTDVNDWSDPCYDDREPDESAYLEAEARHDYEDHCDRVHGGADCDCPMPGSLVADGPFDAEAPF